MRLLNERARIIAVSLDDYAFRSWAHTFQSLAPVDLPIAADAGLVLPTLVAMVEDRLERDRAAVDRSARTDRIAARHAALRAEARNVVSLERSGGRWRRRSSPPRYGRPSRARIGCSPTAPRRGGPAGSGTGGPSGAFGGSGGAGLGYGLPAALGVALAHRASGKVCVNLQADGDLLYVVSALYTAAHHRLPLLTVMFNNRTYGNDEAHQEVVAKARARPVENKVVGIRIDDPAPDFARIAQGFGIWAEGPIDSADAVGPALRRALHVVKDEGRPALVDVITRS